MSTILLSVGLAALACAAYLYLVRRRHWREYRRRKPSRLRDSTTPEPPARREGPND